MYQDFVIILSLILIEWVLSIDNAAVLATMVRHLPENQRLKALRYWILWAYVFRWTALFTASYLIQFSWIKLLWWMYLLYLFISFFFMKKEDEVEESNTTRVLKWFWWTVLIVELMDMVFSIDNIFAAVAFTPKIWLIIVWVFIWILVMRFVAWIFVQLMEKFPELESCAYVVIWMLWIKLIWSFFWFFEWEATSITTSWLTIFIFLFPFLKRKILKSFYS